MSFRRIAEVLPARGHGERLEIAIQDLLMHDPFVADPRWCGHADPVPNDDPHWPEDTPRVYRVPDARVHPTVARPLITVGPLLGQLPWTLSGETEISHKVLVVVHVDETRDRLLPADKSYVSVVHHVWHVLTSSREARSLTVPRYGKPLVQPSPVAGELLYVEWIIDTLDDGTHAVERQPALELTYKFRADRKTGQPQGLLPDE